MGVVTGGTNVPTRLSVLRESYRSEKRFLVGFSAKLRNSCCWIETKSACRKNFSEQSDIYVNSSITICYREIMDGIVQLCYIMNYA
jgi:hypothetical protein